jgi:hypothetical protein
MDRPQPPAIPLRADEADMLNAFLDYYRAALVDRAFGLSGAGLTTTHPPSTLNLARLIGHLTLVEIDWFRVRFAGEDPPRLYAEMDWEADADAEMTRAEGLDPADLMAEFEAAVAGSRAVVAAAGSLDQETAKPNRDGEHWNLRWILIHMIEEYARHCGHADLIREAIDGDLATDF